MPKIKRKQLDIDISENDGQFGTANSPGLASNDKLETAFDKLVTVLDKLIPAKPPLLSNINVTILPTTSYRSGNVTGTGIAVSNILGTLTPVFETPISPTNYFYNGNEGVIKLSAIANPFLTLTTGIDTNLVSSSGGISLTVLDEIDYYLGQAGKENFWNALRARVAFTSGITARTSIYNYTLQHLDSLSNVTGQKGWSFYIESNTAPTITNYALNTTPYSYVSNKKISGVPVFDSTNANDYISIKFDMANVSKYFYLTNPISNNITNNDYTSTGYTWSSIPASNDVQNNTVLTFRPMSNRFRDMLGDINLSGGKLNITTFVGDVLLQFASQGLTNAEQNMLRIDTLSVETTNRKLQNIASFSSGVVTSNTKDVITSYDTTEVIVSNVNTRYNIELQLEGGRYIYPSKNYSGYYPTNTINYSGQTGLKYALFKVGTVNAVSQFRLSLPGITQLTDLTTFKVYVLIGDGTTNTWNSGWMNAGISYTGTAQQQLELTTNIDNSACLDIGTSSNTTASNRLVTPVASGTTPASNKDVYVMIGWDNTMNQYLSNKPTILSTVGGTFTNY